MNAEQLQQFDARGLSLAFDLYGLPIKLGGEEGFGCYTAPTGTDDLSSGGFQRKTKTEMRLRKSDWPAFRVMEDFHQKEVETRNDDNTWRRWRIGDQGITDAFAAGEWILQLEALT